MKRTSTSLNPACTAHALVLAHCTYGASGIREVLQCELPRLIPPTPRLATATIVQRGQVLAGMIFRCDLPLDDPYFPALVDRLVGAAPWFRDLLESDPSRTLIIEPVYHPRDPSPLPDAATCREIFLHAFLRHAAAGAA